MSGRRLFLVAAALLFAACSALAAQAPLSDRIVAYKIDAKYDAKTHTVDATQTLTYTNKTGQSLDRFPFHLYLNGFQPRATWMREANANGQRDVKAGTGVEDKKTGSHEVTKVEVEGMGDLTSQIKFIAPDDGNLDDRTVFEVQLPRPVPPNGSVTFKMAFKARFPEVVARTGYKRDFLLAAQWFPKVGVWWKGAWNCHQFHSQTEFFADYGTYDVTLTVPENFPFGSTGVVTSEKKNGDGTRTLTVRAEDVHDFAWTVDPRYKVIEDSVQLSTGNVKIRVLMQPGRDSGIPRYIGALKGAMQKFDEWYGPYPYPQITVVDPPHGGMAAAGMEYPMLITAGTSWLLPKSLLAPELVTEHEYGHQYWYGMVGSNEFEDAWLDEGINSYTEVKVMDALYGQNTSVINSRFRTAGDRHVQRLAYLGIAEFDPLTRNGWDYLDNNSYAGTTYGKTATVLLSLEQIVGEDKLREALHTYFMRYRFRHPTEEDFMKTVNEVTGQDLTWFWDQAVKGTNRLDYRIMTARARRADWWDKNAPREPNEQTPYLSEVVVHRKGDFVFPVTMVARFDNGETIREQWDGRDRWHRWQWEKKAKLVSAEIDPDHRILLDLNLFNNSYVVEEDRRATNKLGMYMTIAIQWLAQVLAWLV